MARARRITPGLGNPPLIQLWLEAVLCAFVRLVQGVATTFEMRFNRRTHDWHMGTAREALPRTKPDIQFKEPISESGQHVRIPGAGRDLASAHRALRTHTSFSTVIPSAACQREARLHARRRSGWRAHPEHVEGRASGMTKLVCM
jgi:hypothetical protein